MRTSMSGMFRAKAMLIALGVSCVSPIPAFAATKMYVVNSGVDTVSVLKRADHQVVKTISTQDSPWRIAISGTGAYIVNSGSASVTVVDITDDTVVATVSVGLIPYGIAASGTGVYVSSSLQSIVSVIDTTSNQVERTISVGTNPYGMAISGTGVYVANAGGNNVSVIDTTSNQVERTISVGTSPYFIATSGTGVYVANLGGDNVSLIDTTSLAVERTISVGDEPAGIAVSGTGVYVANRGGDTVTLFDTADNQVVRTISVGDMPEGIAASGTGVYVGSRLDGTIGIIDTASNTVEETLSGFSTPIHIAFATDNATLAPSLTLPSSSLICKPLRVEYALPEPPLSESVRITFLHTGTNTSTVMTMNNAEDANFELNTARIGEAANVVSGTANILTEGAYVVTLSYQDVYGNSAATDAASVTFETCTSGVIGGQNDGGGGGGGGVRSTTLKARQDAPKRISRFESSTPPAMGGAGTPSKKSSFELRTCERVMKWFKNDTKMLSRVNERLQKRFGFACGGS